jgi:hypothetical protein
MRTTVDLDEDVLMAAKELARLKGETLGRVLSETIRLGLQASPRRAEAVGLIVEDRPAISVLASLGFEPLPSRGSIVTNDLIDRIRDDEGL